MINLLNKWENRLCWFRSYAEQAMFENDQYELERFNALIRQWVTAINELKEEINKIPLAEKIDE